jgi:hypothetical protein
MRVSDHFGAIMNPAKILDREIVLLAGSGGRVFLDQVDPSPATCCGAA